MKITVTSVLVDDQKKALAFYTAVLGFQEKTNVPVGEHSWLTVVSPETQTESSCSSSRTPTRPLSRSKTRSLPTASRTPRSPWPTFRPNTSSYLLRAWSSPKNRSPWAQ
jgi:catechol 2,3-dioxygenase-like lactoylglutathione lyase family enzyme